MRQAIQHGGGQPRVVEDLPPIQETLVAGDEQLRGESLENNANLPSPDLLAREIAKDVHTA